MLTSSQDRQAFVWDLASGDVLVALAGHSKQVSAARFSPDGTKILTISVDRSARIYPSRLEPLVSAACRMLGSYSQFEDSAARSLCAHMQESRAPEVF